MNIHERLEAFWRGERPDRIPYTLYHSEWRAQASDPAWEGLYREGLGITRFVNVWQPHYRDLKVDVRTTQGGGKTVRRQTFHTPLGDISQAFVGDWHQEYFLKEVDDYPIMKYVVEHTDLHAATEDWGEKAEKLGPAGVLLPTIGRTPLQELLVDGAGMENFSYHFADDEEAVRGLYDALLSQFRRRVELAATAPGVYVAVLESFTAAAIRPALFAQLILPVYRECFPVLRAAGKIVGCQYDGQTRACKDLIADAPFDVVESLNEPNGGDLTIPEARAAWPNKKFWCNLPVGDLDLPAAELTAKVHALIDEASVGGRLLALESSDDLSPRWRESFPVILRALRERAG